jgi:hypothetical protein
VIWNAFQDAGCEDSVPDGGCLLDRSEVDADEDLVAVQPLGTRGASTDEIGVGLKEPRVRSHRPSVGVACD